MQHYLSPLHNAFNTLPLKVTLLWHTRVLHSHEKHYKFIKNSLGFSFSKCIMFVFIYDHIHMLKCPAKYIGLKLHLATDRMAFPVNWVKSLWHSPEVTYKGCNLVLIGNVFSLHKQDSDVNSHCITLYGSHLTVCWLWLLWSNPLAQSHYSI